jgi:hypothetical protein
MKGTAVTSLTFTGAYFRFEIQEIEEDEAKEYIENGIEEGELECMDFSDEAEQGMSGEVVVEVDGSQVATFNVDKLNVSYEEAQQDYWHILKVEQGRRGAVYGPIDLDGQFNPALLSFGAYVKTVGQENYHFAQPTYDQENIDQCEERIDETTYFVVSEKGEIYELEIN